MDKRPSLDAQYRSLVEEYDSGRSVLAVHEQELGMYDTEENRDAVDTATILFTEAKMRLDEHVLEFGLPKVKDR